ncbi:histidinol dehydrogenase [Haliangium ochraceum]|uniref:Histidinol dehydrogenase n=1 Tax=Haliangium ochraceum (strain DSM 14365 / JCM 11303 / SMP-2) TaxID=502025 RepID=D0LM64_HALO1|nr:histidinol dehydrogenase [Haliangium ochraceum]ACY16770.1 histidinol dehydrogenase [Haliangium ochraceum DSM 14365]
MILKRIPLDAGGDSRELRALLERSTSFASEVERAVADILAEVRARGDEAVRAFTEKFDGRSPRAGSSYEIPPGDWRRAKGELAPEVLAALEQAAERVRAFHARQAEVDRAADFSLDGGGMRLDLRIDPLSRVGIYVPGGTARYPSSVLMTAIPARIAGVDEIIMVTPGASKETLAAAALAGVDRVFEIGGAQAVAALAYGTESVPRVDKIVGPGNQWVAAAKRQVFGVVDIDSVAGPSEVLILADDSANPRWVAADLLAQAEHDPLAHPVLATTSPALADAVDEELARQLADLPRADIARTALANQGAAVLVPDQGAAVAFANRYAPEHLELHLREPRAVLGQLRTAGAIFVGALAAEAAGDYMAGPNHVLPTGGAARYASPLGVYDFRKHTSIIEYQAEAVLAQADAIAALAAVEGLDAHGRSMTLRRDALRAADDD